jgi:LAO/AO transport system kinase
MNRPLIIGIGGAHSRTGKTTLAAAILRYLTNPPLPLSTIMGDRNRNVSAHITSYPAFFSGKNWGAIKYTKTSTSPSIVTDKNILMEKGKDTCNMMIGGASEVVWVRTPRSSIGTVFPKAIKRLSHLDGIVVEGNSAIEFLKPDIVIFILGGDKKLWKPGTERFLTKADIIIYENESEIPEIVKTKKHFRNRSNKINTEFLKFLSDLLMQKELKKEMTQKAANGKLSCPDARKIAEKLCLPYKVVGSAADELNIKINNCQLDCF